MRDLSKYPVTKDEVVDYLKGLAKSQAETAAPGDMGPLLLSVAAYWVEEYLPRGHAGLAKPPAEPSA